MRVGTGKLPRSNCSQRLPGFMRLGARPAADRERDVLADRPVRITEVVARLEPGQQAVVGEVVQVDQPELGAVAEPAPQRA